MKLVSDAWSNHVPIQQGVRKRPDQSHEPPDRESDRVSESHRLLKNHVVCCFPDSTPDPKHVAHAPRRAPTLPRDTSVGVSKVGVWIVFTKGARSRSFGRRAPIRDPRSAGGGGCV